MLSQHLQDGWAERVSGRAEPLRRLPARVFDRGIIFSHVLRNITPSIFSHSKTIVLYLLSSMVIFEKLFNIYGIFTFITSYPNPNVIAFTLIMFFVPVFLIYAVITSLIEKYTGQRLEW